MAGQCGFRCSLRGGRTVLVVGCLLIFTSPVLATQFPIAVGSGSFSYDGTSLTIGGAITMVTYEDLTWTFMPTQDAFVGATLEVSGLTQVAGYDFGDGTLTISVGGSPVIEADIVDVILSPTAVETGVINPSSAEINLINLQVSALAGSRFVTDWINAVGASSYGRLGFSLTNTAAGSIDPLVAPASGPMSLQLQPSPVPEPSTILLITAACAAYRLRRRRHTA